MATRALRPKYRKSLVQNSGARLELEIRYLEGRKHLPVFRLREAA
jgi:hypothetical protein